MTMMIVIPIWSVEISSSNPVIPSAHFASPGKESIPVFVTLMNETASSKVSKRCTQEKLV